MKKPTLKKAIIALSIAIIAIFAVIVIQTYRHDMKRAGEAAQQNREWAEKQRRGGDTTPIDDNDTEEEKRQKRIINNMRISSSNLSDKEKLQESLRQSDDEWVNSQK